MNHRTRQRIAASCGKWRPPPHRSTNNRIRHNTHWQKKRFHLHHTAARGYTRFESTVNELFEITFQTLTKMSKHGWTTRQNNVLRAYNQYFGSQIRTRMTCLIKTATNINWRRLDNSINDFRQRCQEVGWCDFGVEEDFRCQEAFISNIKFVFLEETWLNRSHQSWVRIHTLPVTLCSPVKRWNILYGSASYLRNSFTMSWHT